METIDVAKLAYRAASDKKATRMVMLDMRKCSDICDYKIICSGSNERQTKAIAAAVEEQCARDLAVKPIAVEGKQNGHWVLIDYGGVIVHIFFDYLRDFYALEQLWSEASMVNPNQ